MSLTISVPTSEGTLEAITLSDQQVTNFQILRDYLRDYPRERAKFHMLVFEGRVTGYGPGQENSTDDGDCGTSGCALGHGKHAGILMEEFESWEHYSERCFVDMNTSVWIWCFGPDWYLVDNTPEGAAERIGYMLRNGSIPEDWKKMSAGEVPLPYTMPA